MLSGLCSEAVVAGLQHAHRNRITAGLPYEPERFIAIKGPKVPNLLGSWKFPP